MVEIPIKAVLKHIKKKGSIALGSPHIGSIKLDMKSPICAGQAVVLKRILDEIPLNSKITFINAWNPPQDSDDPLSTDYLYNFIAIDFK